MSRIAIRPEITAVPAIAVPHDQIPQAAPHAAKPTQRPMPSPAKFHGEMSYRNPKPILVQPMNFVRPLAVSTLK